MGADLASIIRRRVVELKDLRMKSLAVDGNNELYQFLSLIRTCDGSPLTDGKGNITSHLNGLMFRSTKLIYEYRIYPVFVFDGAPPRLKKMEIERRRRVREKALREWEEAKSVGDYAKAYSKAVVTSRLTGQMVDDAKRLLTLLGLPFVQAPCEGEAQAAYMAVKGDVWAACSRDYDSILFGAPRLVRYVTISGTEFLPSKGYTRPLKPEVIELEALLTELKISREQLVDIAILAGTDFNEGVRGIGVKKALQLIKDYGSIEALPNDVRSKTPEYFEDVRRIFLQPEVTEAYTIRSGEFQKDELYSFLCGERGFSRERVETVVKRMDRSKGWMTRGDLRYWLEKG